MKIIKNFYNINRTAQNSVLTLGNFDGIHLGHQEILKILRQIAANNGLKSALLTFEPHPLTIINPAHNKAMRIIDLEQKLHFLQENNLVDLVFIADFNSQLANLSAEDFVKKILVDHLKIKHLVVGYDFVFGKNRGGNIATLEHLAKIYDFNLTKIAAYKDKKNHIYSSSLIRKFISEGDVKSANSILGRHFEINGIVISGNQMGEKLGFPTANLKPKTDIIKPKYGIYKAMVKLAENKIIHKAVVSFGVRPTFGDGQQPLFEAHIFDFADDLYGQKITIELIDFIRQEKKFASEKALKKEMENDCVIAKN